MKDLIAMKNLIVLAVSLPFTIGAGYATAKASLKTAFKMIKENRELINKQGEKIDSFIQEYEKAEQQKTDRLARIETKLDLLLQGNINIVKN